jgi:hypothetical protein
MIPIALADGKAYIPKCGDCAAFVELPQQNGAGECHFEPAKAFAVPARVASAAAPVQIVAGWPAVPPASCCLKWTPNMATSAFLRENMPAQANEATMQ